MTRRVQASCIVPALATLFGCAGAGVSASGAEEARADEVVVVAVLPAWWATEAPALEVDASAVARSLDRSPSVRAVRSASVARALAAEGDGCTADAACVRRIGERLRAAHVVAVELAELGGTVLVRASVVDVAAGTRASTRQEVVRNANAARVDAALGRIGREIAAAWEPARAPEDVRWYERTAVWGVVAGVAIAAAAATAIGVVAGNAGQGPDEIIDPP